MARSIWSGAISFGLVNVPVKLYAAVSPKEVHFHMLHDADGARIRQKRFCSLDDEEVPFEHIVKGYEISKDQYVTITPEELDALDPKATRTIDIQAFVDEREIDPIFYEHPYTLAPDRSGAKAYMLLLEAMTRAKKAGLAKMVLRTRQYFCALRPRGGALGLSTLLYADELVPADQIEELAERPEVNPRELEMALQLVQSLSTRFRPERYHDEYREKVLELVQRKAAGQPLVTAPPPEKPARVINLADALAKSLAAAGRTPPPRATRGERRHRAQAARTASHRRRKGAKG